MAVFVPTTRFADWLLRMMKENRQTSAELARGSGIAQSSLSAYLNSGTRPNYETAMKLARHFGLEVATVWAEIEPGTPPPLEEEIIPEIRFALQRMTPAEQRAYALRAIRLAEELLAEARHQ